MDQDNPEPIPHKRKLVDYVGLILFIVVTLSWIGIGIFGHLKGDIKSMLHPKDSYGQRCGIDTLVKHKPYLFYFDITLCDDRATSIFGCDSTRVCVKKCPEETFLSSNATDTQSKPIICQKGSDKWNKSDCASWYLPSLPYKGRCVPQTVPSETILKEISKIQQTPIDAKLMQKAIENIKLISELASGTRYLMNDIIKNWLTLLAAAILILFVCCLYFYVFSAFPKIFFIFSLIFVPLVLSCYLYYGISWYVFYKQQHDRGQENFLYRRYVWLGCSIVLSMAALFLIFMTLFWIKETFKGISLIQMCGNKTKGITQGILFVVIMCWMLQIGIFVFFVSIFLHLGNINDAASHKIILEKNCGKYVSEKFDKNIDLVACDPDYANVRKNIYNHTLCPKITCEIAPRKTKQHLVLQLFNVIFYVWIAFFVFGLEEMIIGLFVHHWQIFSSDAKAKYSISIVLHYILIVFRYHLGTAFIGSILIALFNYLCLKILMIWSARKSQSSKAISRIHTCIQVCSLVETIYGVMDSQVLILCVIDNKCLLKGSKVYRKIVNSESLKKLNEMDSIYLIIFYQKLLVTFLCSFGAYFYVKYVENSSAYTFLIGFFTLYMTYATVTLIFGVYTIQQDVLIICQLKDVEGPRLSEENLETSSELISD